MAATCPTCGGAVRVVGDTTRHYEPVDTPEVAAMRAAMNAALTTIKAVGDSTVKRLWREAGYDVPRRGSRGGTKRA